MNLKKIINKPVNLSGPKGLNKNPLMDKFRDSKVKRVNLQYKEDKEEEAAVEKPKHVKLKNRSERTIKNISVTEEESIKNLHKFNKGALKKPTELKKSKIVEKSIDKERKDIKNKTIVVKSKRAALLVTDENKVTDNVKEKKIKSQKTKQIESVKSVYNKRKSPKELKPVEENILVDKIDKAQVVILDEVVADRVVDAVEKIVVKKELSPEVLQAKADLDSLKKVFSKLLLPVKWSRKSISANSED